MVNYFFYSSSWSTSNNIELCIMMMQMIIIIIHTVTIGRLSWLPTIILIHDRIIIVHLSFPSISSIIIIHLLRSIIIAHQSTYYPPTVAQMTKCSVKPISDISDPFWSHSEAVNPSHSASAQDQCRIGAAHLSHSPERSWGTAWRHGSRVPASSPVG